MKASVSLGAGVKARVSVHFSNSGLFFTLRLKLTLNYICNQIFWNKSQIEFGRECESQCESGCGCEGQSESVV